MPKIGSAPSGRPAVFADGAWWKVARLATKPGDDVTKFNDFLAERENEQKKLAEQEAAAAASQRTKMQQAPAAWRELQNAVRATAEGKQYSGKSFTWRAEGGFPASLILENIAATFIQLGPADLSVQFGGIPGNDALWMQGLPEPEYLRIQFLGNDLWIIGSATGGLKTEGDDSAATEICKAFIRYYDNFQRSRR